jgi:hypothetical protein
VPLPSFQLYLLIERPLCNKDLPYHLLRLAALGRAGWSAATTTVTIPVHIPNRRAGGALFVGSPPSGRARHLVWDLRQPPGV